MPQRFAQIHLWVLRHDRVDLVGDGALLDLVVVVRLGELAQERLRNLALLGHEDLVRVGVADVKRHLVAEQHVRERRREVGLELLALCLALLLRLALSLRAARRLVAVLAALSLVGTFVGTRVAQYVDAALLRRLFGIFLIASGSYSLFPKVMTKIKGKLRVES